MTLRVSGISRNRNENERDETGAEPIQRPPLEDRLR